MIQCAVAAGSPDAAAAAVQVLRAGGNAFDAVVAAGFAAAVAEPGLSSLGGGGFLLARQPDGTETVVDFFVDAPGRGRPTAELTPHFVPVTVHFPGADQVFCAGWGSVAVPGCLAGYLYVAKRLGRLPLAELVTPAQRLAERGAVLQPAQAAVLHLLTRILTLTPEGRRIFASDGMLPGAGDRLRNPDLAEFLGRVAAGEVMGFADADLARALHAAMDAGRGLVTAADLDAYRPYERRPLVLDYRGARIATNPPPSFGGTAVADGLRGLATDRPLDGSPPATVRMAAALVRMAERDAPAVRSVLGTTHVSVVDADGALASMTTSNGSCSGVFAPGTGVQLNNMMGEAELHPAGFQAAPPGVRVASMMAPTVVGLPDGRVVALGSGGSERIRSTLLCVLSGLLDRELPLADAVATPRLHWDRAALQVEPGLGPPALDSLAERWPLVRWPRRDLYFGGTNAVLRTPDGTVAAVGDDRRGGVGLVVDL